MNNDNKFNLPNDTMDRIVEGFPQGNPPFSHQDLEYVNKQDAKDWLNSDELVGIVSEVHGGIIGYVHSAHADEIVAALNLKIVQSDK